MRLMAVCHDSVGIGHLRRTLAIAERAVQTIPSCRALVVSGTLHASNFALPDRIDYVKVPSLCKGPDHRYCAKSLGVDINDALAIRTALLTATTATFRPDVFLIDKSPLGVLGEAETAIKLVRDRYPATRVVFGMRDIEDAPETTIREWRRSRFYDALRHLCDEVWVYGDASVYDVVAAYEIPHDVAEKLHYVGYIGRGHCEHVQPRPDDRNALRVLVTVGGGTDGYRLLQQYLSDPLDRAMGRPVRTTIVGGPDLPRAQAESLKRQAAGYPHVQFMDIAPCMACEYRRADAVLCMGGYNTMVEVVRAGKPMIVFPRVVPRLEQLIRARRFGELRLCRSLEPDGITPARIREGVERVLSDERDAVVHAPDMEGLDHVAERLVELEASICDSMAVCV